MASRSSTTDPPDGRSSGAAGSSRSLPERIIVGRVVRPHGVRGDLLVDVMSDVPGRFDAGERLHSSVGGGSRTLEVAWARSYRSGALVHFVGVEDREAALALRGAVLEVPRSEVPSAEAGSDSYYFFELEGCRVIESTEGDLGEVQQVVEDGGGWMLMVEGERGSLPIPFVRRFLDQVDIEGGRILVTLPPGLIEICASRP